MRTGPRPRACPGPTRHQPDPHLPPRSLFLRPSEVHRMTSEPWLQLTSEDRPQPRPHQWLRDPLGLRAGRSGFESRSVNYGQTSLGLSCFIHGMGSRRDCGPGAQGLAWWWGWRKAPEQFSWLRSQGAVPHPVPINDPRDLGSPRSVSAEQGGGGSKGSVGAVRLGGSGVARWRPRAGPWKAGGRTTRELGPSPSACAAVPLDVA